MRPGVKGTFTSTPASLAAFSTAAQPPRTIRSASETFLPLGRVELLLDRLRASAAPSCQLGRLVDLPVLLRAEANARAVRAAALVGAAERRGRRPGGRDQLRHRQAGREDLRLQRGDILVVDQRMIDGRDRVLPDQRLLRHQRAEVARDRAHVAMRELEPGAGERVRELIRILEEAPRDLLVGRIEAQRQIGGQHGRHVLLRRVERIRDVGFGAFRLPLLARRPGSWSAPIRTRTGS